VQHCEAVPLGVMVRGTMEWILDAPMMEKLFQQHAPDQYTRELTISSLVELFIQVSSGARPSVLAAFKFDQAQDQSRIKTSYQALYGKLGRLQPAVSEAVVRYSAQRCGQRVRSAWHREFSGETWRFCGSRVSTSGLILQKRNLSWQIENDQTFCLQERIPYGEVYSNGWSHRK
jgi:hypothetical protein